MKLSAKWVGGMIAAVMAVGCSDTTGGDQGTTTATALSPVQSGLVGEQLPFPLIVTVTRDGRPVTGAAVTWAVTAGAGALNSGALTDSTGRARATFIPSGAGAQRITATVAGTAPVTFDATATVNAPPTEVTTIPAQTGHVIHDTFVRDGIVFVCSWNNGVILYDVGNGIKGGSPARPVEISRIVTAANGVQGGVQAHNAWWFHNPVANEKRYLFVGQEGPGVIGSSSAGDIHVVDLTDITRPVEVGLINVPGAGTHNFWMDEARQVLYAGYYNAGVAAFDVSGTLQGDLSARLITKVQPGGSGATYTWGVQLAGGSLWSVDMLSGLWKLDPVTLATRGGGNNVPDRFSSDFWVQGNYAYTGTFPGKGIPGDQVRVFQIDGASPVLRDSLRLPGVNLVSDLQVSDDGRTLIVTAQSQATSGLWVYSLADPAHPTIIGRTTQPGNLHTGTLAAIAGKLYVFAARVGNGPAVQIWEISR